MKNLFNFKWLLLCIVLSIASVSPALAADFVSDGNTYFFLENFSPTSGWGDAMWIANDCPYAWLEVKNGSESKNTVAFEQIGSSNHFRVKIPAGTWKQFKLYRGASLYTTSNNTGYIDFSSGKNWLLTYGTASGWTDATWDINRYFNGSEKMFIQNIHPSDWGGTDAWAHGKYNMYVYLCNGTSDAVWCSVTYESSADKTTSTVYSIVPPEGGYKNIILLGTDNDEPSFDAGDKFQTGNIALDLSNNYLSGGYNQNKTGATWSTFNLSPITSDGTKKLYFDMHPEGITSFGDDGYVMTYDTPGDGNFASFFGSAESKWSEHGAVQVDGDYYYIVVPKGTWNGWIITRQKQKDNPSWPAYNQTQDMFFTDNKKNYMYNWYDNGTTAYWSQYAPTPAIILNQGYPDEYIMSPSEGSTYTKGLSFDEHSTYEIKILDGETLYGLNNNVWTGPVSNYPLASGEYQVRVATAGNGTYTFTYNQTGNTLSVSYPTVTKHPTADYCYLFDHSWDRVYVYLSGSTSGIAGTQSWGTQTTNKVQIGSDYYYYFATGDYTDLMVSDRTDYNKADGLTPTLGKYQKNIDESWGWRDFVFSITYKDKGDEDFSGTHDDTGTTHPTTYNFGTATTLKTATKTGYRFDGWYTDEDCTEGPIETLGATDFHDNITLYALWTPVELTFKSNASTNAWETPSNWNPACVPTIEHNVTIQKAVVVNSAAFAKSVVIDQTSSSSVKLTINAGKSLVIAGTLQKKNGSGTGHTEEADVLIDSDLSNGNGALIMGTHSGNNEATVNFATKAYKKEGTSGNWVNQYIGTPFNNQGDPTYNYYGMELYAFDAAKQAWENGLASSMTPFYGYDLLSNSSTPNVVLNMTGTLVASSTQNLTGLSYAESPYENVLANSWVAPIVIDEFVDDDFTNLKKTIYIFNAGSLSDYESNSGAIADDKNTATKAGQYTSIPINLSPFYDNYKTIPSMQSFSVIATGSSPSLRLRYKELVYDPASTSVLIEPNHAPKRDNGVKPEIVKVYVTGESGYGDKIWLVERTDFTTGYDDGWEAEKLYGILEAPQLYAVGDEDNMAVIALPDVDNTVLGFQAGTEDNQYTFLFDYEGEDALYLYDTQAEKETRITSDATYSFTTTDKVAHNRFVIRKSAKMPTGVENTTDEGVKTVKFIENGELYILRDGKLYNATGALVK